MRRSLLYWSHWAAEKSFVTGLGGGINANERMLRSNLSRVFFSWVWVRSFLVRHVIPPNTHTHRVLFMFAEINVDHIWSCNLVIYWHCLQRYIFFNKNKTSWKLSADVAIPGSGSSGRWTRLAAETPAARCHVTNRAHTQEVSSGVLL